MPEATPVNLPGDGLSIERAKDIELTGALTDRFIRFGEYTRDIDVDGILATCSTLGEALDKLADRLDIPVLKSDEAMFASAFAAGSRYPRTDHRLSAGHKEGYKSSPAFATQGLSGRH